MATRTSVSVAVNVAFPGGGTGAGTGISAFPSPISDSPTAIIPPSQLPPGSRKVQAQSRGHHLPFRRISLPTGPPPVLNLASPTTSSAAQNKRASIAGMPTLPPGSSLLPAGVGYSQSTSVQNFGHKVHFAGSTPDGRRSRRTSSHASTIPPMSAKRARVQAELVGTERAYVTGLDLIYDHFLDPLLKALPEGTY
jgi:FYVE/RhoGEF/PH domain-containing protein 5/6